jgi:excisionase family DNA binding protein
VISVPREPTSPLFVRLPTESAEKLNRAAFELKTPKRELVTELVDRYLGEEDVSAPGPIAAEDPEVLTLEQLAELLQVDEKTVRSLAAKGDLPGRKLDTEWRFSRQAVLEWLATPERQRRAPGFEG